MITYRRQLVIDDGKIRKILLATDLTIGDVIMIRKPGALERTPETIIGAVHVGHGLIRLRFQWGTTEHSVAMPIEVSSFTEGSWRQHDPGELTPEPPTQFPSRDPDSGGLYPVYWWMGGLKP